MSLATPIPLERLCQLALVSRAGFYRWRDALPATDADLALLDEIQRIALEFPYYGWPRITRELNDRGWQANHKRVYRIMREDNLLCLRVGDFVVVRRLETWLGTKTLPDDHVVGLATYRY